MIAFAVLAFLGTNLAYIFLSLRLLKGLERLVRVEPEPSSPLPRVTVLIAARNEEFRIRPCLEALLAQDYPQDFLQVLVVDDRSEDGTAGILEEYRRRAPGRLTVLTIVDTPKLSPKKHALGRGMQAANGEIILTTDADCIMGPRWVSSMVAEFGEDTGLVLGMTSYFRPHPAPSFWGTQALEFISYGIVAAALVGLRFPVHGNANNIAYRRRVYDLASGFESHGQIVSGDDDFLLQSIHKLGRWEIRYSVRPESQVQTEPPLSLLQFWEQRKRWASKCGFYQPRQAAFLAGIFLYYLSIPAGLALGIFQSPLLVAGLGSLGVKTAMDYLVMRRGTALFGRSELLRAFPMAALIHIPLIIAAVLAGSFGEFTWKGQVHRKRLRPVEL